MKSSSRQRRVLSRLAALCSIAVISGCTLSNQEAPPLAGPSGFALSLTMTAAPQVLPRDGNSTSTITVTALNADGTPRANQRLLLKPDFGTLNFTDAQTGPNGTMSVTYTAPGVNVPVDIDTIRATLVEAGDAANNTAFNGGSVRIQVVGPDIPVAAFTTTPSTAAPGATYRALITFDATNSTLGGASCGSRCTYAWDFGDGSTGQNLVVQHQYSDSGVFNATLTVTTSLGTSNSITKPVVIAPPALTAPDFSFATCASLAAKCMTFTDTSVPPDGVTIVSRYWDFGDSTSPASTPDPSIDHTFPANANPVTYNVRLRLTDNLGRVSTTIKQVAVP